MEEVEELTEELDPATDAAIDEEATVSPPTAAAWVVGWVAEDEVAAVTARLVTTTEEAEEDEAGSVDEVIFTLIVAFGLVGDVLSWANTALYTEIL